MNFHHDAHTENVSRSALVDFIRGLVEFDPGKRWSPLQVITLPGLLLVLYGIRLTHQPCLTKHFHVEILFSRLHVIHLSQENPLCVLISLFQKLLEL